MRKSKFIVLHNKPVKEFTKDTVPKRNKTYHFYNDGKCGLSRHSYAIVKDILNLWGFKRYFPTEYKRWKRETKECYWLYHKKTDYFVKCDVLFYGTQWFARDIDGGWFSFGNFFGDGELDVTVDKTKGILEWDKDYLEEALKLAHEELDSRITNKYFEELNRVE